jgi:cell division control protein 24
MTKQREEGRWKDELWALHELWGNDTTGRDDTTGIMKVLQTVETILDCLPESAMSSTSSPQTPYTASSAHQFNTSNTPRASARQSYDLPFSMGGHASGATAVAQMAATMNGGVHINARFDEGEMSKGPSESSADINAFKSVEELVMSEKTYVQELEVLQRCSKELLATGLISGNTQAAMFANLPSILDFHVSCT